MKLQQFLALATTALLASCSGGASQPETQAANSATTAPAAAAEPVAETATQAPRPLVKLDLMDLVLGQTSPAKLAITLKDKRVGFTEIPDSATAVGDKTVVSFENGMVKCDFLDDESRLFAANMKARTAYAFQGDFSEVQNSTIYLTNCAAAADTTTATATGTENSGA